VSSINYCYLSTPSFSNRNEIKLNPGIRDLITGYAIWVFINTLHPYIIIWLFHALTTNYHICIHYKISLAYLFFDNAKNLTFQDLIFSHFVCNNLPHLPDIKLYVICPLRFWMSIKNIITRELGYFTLQFILLAIWHSNVLKFWSYEQSR